MQLAKRVLQRLELVDQLAHRRRCAIDALEQIPESLRRDPRRMRFGAVSLPDDARHGVGERFGLHLDHLGGDRSESFTVVDHRRLVAEQRVFGIRCSAVELAVDHRSELGVRLALSLAQPPQQPARAGA